MTRRSRVRIPPPLWRKPRFVRGFLVLTVIQTRTAGINFVFALQRGADDRLAKPSATLRHPLARGEPICPISSVGLRNRRSQVRILSGALLDSSL
jgi:hypothetical protein